MQTPVVTVVESSVVNTEVNLALQPNNRLIVLNLSNGSNKITTLAKGQNSLTALQNQLTNLQNSIANQTAENTAMTTLLGLS